MRAHSWSFHPNRVRVGRMPNSRLQPNFAVGLITGEEVVANKAAAEKERAEAQRKAELEELHMRVALRKAAYIKRCRRRGVRPKRVSKISLRLIKENNISTRPRWPKRMKKRA